MALLKNKNMKKITTLTLGALLSLTALSGGGDGQPKLTKSAPIAFNASEMGGTVGFGGTVGLGGTVS